ncbi:MAG: hypothetical protein EB078_03095, partial [Proteobacteria bacterium]|nr:hypothetical protein [Pseudomonadota bacterium]
GDLTVPDSCKGLVVFSHGSGSSRFSPRNRQIARGLQKNGWGTLLLDLLTKEEEHQAEKVFDVDLLADRILSTASWLKTEAEVAHLPVALFGASTGAAAALIAAAKGPDDFFWVVSRGGRPDLAASYLPQVTQPTLFIVGSKDDEIVRLNRYALEKLNCEKELALVSGATHLFEEPGKLEEVERLTTDWLESRRESCSLPFANRVSAARALSRKMRGRKLFQPLVLAIPRGGVVTGSIMAHSLSSSLDVIFIRKLRHPQQPELAIGAISEDGESFLNEAGKKILRLSEEYILREKMSQLEEIRKKKKIVRDFFPPEPISGRSVIVTDDGIATGATIISALKLIKSKRPQELIVAVPVAPEDSLREVRRYCDEIVCLHTPRPFFSIGDFYREFPQVDDRTFMDLLKNSKKGPSSVSLAG